MALTLILVEEPITPEVFSSPSGVSVRIGLHCSYDEIFDLCRDQLSEDDLVELYRLWGDDYFPRNFVTLGNEIHITARR
ncbi:MAG: hypothetical protein EB054_05795 [Actinobacteria bacterium]|nr:hypothetical protein [Actinomycetota bacterium]